MVPTLLSRSADLLTGSVVDDEPQPEQVRKLPVRSSLEGAGEAAVAHQWQCEEADQASALTGSRKGAPSRLNAFIAAMVIVRSTRSLGAKAALAAASAPSEACVSLIRVTSST